MAALGVAVWRTAAGGLGLARAGARLPGGLGPGPVAAAGWVWGAGAARSWGGGGRGGLAGAGELLDREGAAGTGGTAPVADECGEGAIGALSSRREIHVGAFHVSRGINHIALSRHTDFRGRGQSLQRDCVIIGLEDPGNPPSHPTAEIAGKARGEGGLGSYLVVFKYGSVVFFNCDMDGLGRDSLDTVLGFAEGGLTLKPHTEDFRLVIDPDLPEWSEMAKDEIKLKQFDVRNVGVIASVLGQSVALDFYAAELDTMLQEFNELNEEMAKDGSLSITPKKLFQLVAQNNITMTDIMTRLGLLERSDTAWKFAQYGDVWENLRLEFELEDRFERLATKMELMQNNVKYFLEILQNRKSDTLEWIIIVLISGEICVSLYDIFTRGAGSG